MCVCDCVSVAISYRQVQGEKGAGPVCGIAGLTRTGSKGRSQPCVRVEVGSSRRQLHERNGPSRRMMSRTQPPPPPDNKEPVVQHKNKTQKQNCPTNGPGGEKRFGKPASKPTGDTS